MPGVREWLLILAVILLIFGATKLPQLGDGLGRAIKNFKRAISSGNEIEVAPKQEASGGTRAHEAAKPAEKAS
jgi:sec-independent protein translocase protein TatA